MLIRPGRVGKLGSTSSRTAAPADPNAYTDPASVAYTNAAGVAYTKG